MWRHSFNHRYSATEEASRQKIHHLVSVRFEGKWKEEKRIALYRLPLGSCRWRMSHPPFSLRTANACRYAGLSGAVRRAEANFNLESIKISHFDGSKLYQRGPFR